MPRRSSLSTLFALSAWAALSVLAGCSGGNVNPASTNTPTPTPTPVPPGGDGTVVIGDTPGLCAAGDVARVDIDSTKARFPLIVDGTPCAAPKDNRREEYTLIMYNTSATAGTFRIDAPVEASPPASAVSLGRRLTDDGKVKAPVQPAERSGFSAGPTAMNQIATVLARSPGSPTADSALGTRSLQTALTVGDEHRFWVRCDRDNVDTFCDTTAILRAQGTHINIFVDRDVLYGATTGACAATREPADCLLKADLDAIASTFDNNIYPLETTILGAPSDVDGDGKINVVITPILNSFLRKESYTDHRNLEPFDPVANPGSNESETIFVFAPDSGENYRIGELRGSLNISAATYVNKVLNAWIAFQFQAIISFNQHVLIAAGNAEDGWIDDGMGALMADLAGFNIWRPGVYVYLAAPQIWDLRLSADLKCALRAGGPYLFMLYYLQSQMDSTADQGLGTLPGSQFDQEMSVLTTLVQSNLTGTANLENAAVFPFDATQETEFQAMFKDWTIGIVTSGTHRADLQQAGQTAVKYFLGQDPTAYGSDIDTGSGSVRTGATGNAVGLDLNLYFSEGDEKFLFENADEHVWAPGNVLFGYVAPFSAMYVRLAGLFQLEQTLSLNTSSDLVQGFLVRRTDLAGTRAYPHVYAESLFGSIDQHAEDLDTAGPNPYWTDAVGIAKKVDLTHLEEDTDADVRSKDFLSIVGRIDPASQVYVCPSNPAKIPESCALTDVPDTDKYEFVVPSGLGLGGKEGYLAVTVRRQFDNGVNTSGIKPMLAIVSSKDVPYPYVPHPDRGPAITAFLQTNHVALGLPADATFESRPQYRWMVSSLPCGDDDSTLAFDTDLGVPGPAEDGVNRCHSDPLVSLLEGVEVIDQRFHHTPMEPNDVALLHGTVNYGDEADRINGGDCTNFPGTPALVDPDNLPLGFETGGYDDSGSYPVMSLESSPSSLGEYGWSGAFMTFPYLFDSLYPDVLFAREVLKNVSGYPATDPVYDPRGTNGPTLNCQVAMGGDPDMVPDAPDDFLVPEELSSPSKLAEQVLTEMSRGRFWTDGTFTDESAAYGAGGPPTETNIFTGATYSKYNDHDVFALDGDSRDGDTNCTNIDAGNNMNTFTIASGKGSIVWGNYSKLEPHILGNLNGSQTAGTS
ncbi:MAG: hypothetical protein V1798_10815, partial [Pseudomonadota bacterium]